MLPLAIAVLACAACSLAAPPAPPASLRAAVSPFIINGSDIDVQRAPYQAAVEIRDGEGKPFHFACAGAIVSLRSVLATGDCVSTESPAGRTARAVLPTANLRVRVGTDLLEQGGKTLAVIEVATHPNFGLNPFDYNVAVLTTNTIPTSTFIKPVSLVPTGAAVAEPGSALFVTGWGRSEIHGSELSRELQALFVTPVPLMACSSVYASYMTMDDTMFCATGEDGAGLCSGDVGAPLVDESAQLVGIASWGLGCGVPGYPGVYTNLYNENMNMWIRRMLS